MAAKRLVQRSPKGEDRDFKAHKGQGPGCVSRQGREGRQGGWKITALSPYPLCALCALCVRTFRQAFLPPFSRPCSRGLAEFAGHTTHSNKPARRSFFKALGRCFLVSSCCQIRTTVQPFCRRRRFCLRSRFWFPSILASHHSRRVAGIFARVG
jgi:hypothetical protein